VSVDHPDRIDSRMNAASLTIRPPQAWRGYTQQVQRWASVSLGPQAAWRYGKHGARVDLPLTIMPNAGFAQRVGGRVLYPDMSREYYETFTRDALGLGARIIGGCCGTTPEQIQVIATSVQSARELPVSPAPARVRVRAELVVEEPFAGPMAGQTSGLLARLASGQFVRSLQIDPQRGPADALNRAVVEEILARKIVDLVDINSSGGGGRQDSLQIAAGIGAGPRTWHTSHPDPSVAGVLSQVLGADHGAACATFSSSPATRPEGPVCRGRVSAGGRHRSRPRTAMLRAAAGRETRPACPPSRSTGVAVNQNAPTSAPSCISKTGPSRGRLRHDAAFSTSCWSIFRDQIAGRVDIPIILGVWPLIGLKQARRINENVAGVVVPENVCRALEAAGPREREVGFELAAELIAALATGVLRVYVIAPSSSPCKLLRLMRCSAELIPSGNDPRTDRIVTL
jgi:homocysteine S-methyltransferase